MFRGPVEPVWLINTNIRCCGKSWIFHFILTQLVVKGHYKLKKHVTLVLLSVCYVCCGVARWCAGLEMTSRALSSPAKKAWLSGSVGRAISMRTKCQIF